MTQVNIQTKNKDFKCFIVIKNIIFQIDLYLFFLNSIIKHRQIVCTIHILFLHNIEPLFIFNEF